MFSNLPTMLQQQDFQASNRDMLEAARGGVTVDPNAPTLTVVIQRHVDVAYRMPVLEREMSFWDHSKWFKEAQRRLSCSPEMRIEAANQQGSAIVIEPATQMLEVGTVFTIEGITRYRSQLDDWIPAEFVVTNRVEIGYRVICFYPPINVPETVNELPKRGAKLTIKPCSESPIPPPSSRD